MAHSDPFGWLFRANTAASVIDEWCGRPQGSCCHGEPPGVQCWPCGYVEVEKQVCSESAPCGVWDIKVSAFTVWAVFDSLSSCYNPPLFLTNIVLFLTILSCHLLIPIILLTLHLFIHAIFCFVTIFTYALSSLLFILLTQLAYPISTPLYPWTNIWLLSVPLPHHITIYGSCTCYIVPDK